MQKRTAEAAAARSNIANSGSIWANNFPKFLATSLTNDKRGF
jgi:hypothetical protein